MPQIVKGGKYIFGWSRVGDKGEIRIPPEALQEYDLERCENLILIPGSKRSGGFGLTSIEKFKKSPLGSVLEKNPQLATFQVPEGNALEIDKKTYCWVKQDNSGAIIVPLVTLKKYGISAGDFLLVVRGSHLAVGFIVKGPIVEEAKNHPEIQRFE
jgi:bifunctional DNA-binding transcriptional regulator/antitoxin component of YhaV-PrlF toxin-antitoxin module